MRRERSAAKGTPASGGVPEGWDLVRLGDVFEQVVDTGHTEDLPVLAVTLDRGVVPRSSLERKFEREVERHQYLRARPGDIAYNTMRMWQGGSGLVREEGYLSPAYTVCRARAGEDPEFWAYAFKTEAMIRAFRAHSQGFAKDRYRLYFHHFSSVPALRPPPAEQRRIGAMLAAVAKVIVTTEALIERLRRTLEVLSSCLVTQGVPRRHSSYRETELGLIPADWRVASLGAVLDSIEAGWSPSCEPRPAEANEWGILKVSSVSSGVYDPSENKALPKTVPARSEFEIQSGDLLLARASGALGLVGRTVFVYKTRAKLLLSDKTLRLRPANDKMRALYLHFFLTLPVARRELLMRAGGSHMRNISQAALQKIPVPIPPLTEQSEIEGVLSALVARQEEEGNELVALERLKTALATALLTGQLRVTPDAEAPA